MNLFLIFDSNQEAMVSMVMALDNQASYVFLGTAICGATQNDVNGEHCCPSLTWYYMKDLLNALSVVQAVVKALTTAWECFFWSWPQGGAASIALLGMI